MPFPHHISPSLLSSYTFKKREEQFTHASYQEEMAPYYYMMDGRREEMLELILNAWKTEERGTTSTNPLRNEKYLFVSIITMACRYSIEGALEPTIAYNASDLYIQKMDMLDNVQDVRYMEIDAMLFYCDQMAEVKRRKAYALPVSRAMSYIDAHLHEKIILEEAAEYAGVSRTYLSRLFSKEMGKTMGEYIAEQKIITAENMLRFTNMSITDIASVLAFSNHSHFARTFKEITGETPNEYRKRNVTGGFLTAADSYQH